MKTKYFGKLFAIYYEYDENVIKIGFVHGKDGLKSNVKTRQMCEDLAMKIARETNKSISVSHWKETDMIFVK